MLHCPCLVVLFWLAGCTPLVVGGGAAGGYKVATDERSAGGLLDDSKLTARIKAEMIGDETVKARDIDIDTIDGVVYLSGFVDSTWQKKRAEKIARSVKGVRHVRNNLRIGSRTMGQAFDDKVLGGKIKTKLVREPGIHSMNIDVDVYNGQVNLTGVVESRAQKKRVLEITKSAPGVKGIIDNLKVIGGGKK